MINKKNITIPIPPIHWVSARHNNKLLGKPSKDSYTVNPVVVKPEIDSKYALIKLYLNEGKYEIEPIKGNITKLVPTNINACGRFRFSNDPKDGLCFFPSQIKKKPNSNEIRDEIIKISIDSS